MVKAKEEKLKEKLDKTEELNARLVDNFVHLQKALTNMTLRFDALSDNISKLLQLFEISARSFISKQPADIEKDREFLEKLNALLDQNKTIAKGLTLMEEKMRERMYGQSVQTPQFQNPQNPQTPVQKEREENFSPGIMQSQSQQPVKKLPRF